MMSNDPLASLIVDQLESILSAQATGRRFLQQLVIVAGYVAIEPVPEHISRQLAAASRQITLLEVFDALLTPLNVIARASPLHDSGAQVLNLIGQIDEARKALQECEPINRAELVAWLLASARERRVIGRSDRR